MFPQTALGELFTLCPAGEPRGRLIGGPIAKSRLSIDRFRALDATRILVYPTDDIYRKEDEFINYFSNEFVCNRIGGGIMGFGELSVTANMKTRNVK